MTGRHATEHKKHPKLGYTLYLIAATLWSFNGTIAKVVLNEVGEPLRVSQFRASASAVVLVLVVLAIRRMGFRIQWKEATLLALYGVVGVAMCQWFYFESISRIPITISLLIEFMAPIFVVLFVRYVWHQPVKSTVWVGIFLAMVGLALVQQVWKGLVLNPTGVLYALGSMMCLIVMYLVGDKASRGRDPLSLVMWAFIFSTIFFAVLRPWSSFPWDAFTATVKPFDNYDFTSPIWPFFVYIVIGGTVVPYLLVIASMRHIGGAGAAIVGITEPPIAAVIAWIVLGEILSPIQIFGGFVILLGVYLAENAREQSGEAQEHFVVSPEVSEVVDTRH